MRGEPGRSTTFEARVRNDVAGEELQGSRPPPQIAADATQKPIALVTCAWRRRTIVPSQNQKTVRKTRRAITAIDFNV